MLPPEMAGDEDEDEGAIDPDALADRPVHRRPALLAVVAVGGAAGTAAREGLSLVVPPVGALPLATLLINLAGAFLLGVLLEALVRGGPDVGVRRIARLGLGTGFCGGFTTYSALAAATALLLVAGDAGLAVLYAAGTVLTGALATWAGILLGTTGARRRRTW